MTIFEFLTVAVSIVLALGMGTLISSIPHVFDSKKRDWLHATYFVLLVLAHIIVWWRVWLLNVAPSWNIFQFTILMGSPLSLYLAATALVSSNPAQVDNWRSYFQEKSHWIISGITAILFFGILRSYFILAITPPWWSLAALVMYIVAAISRRRDVHIAVIFPTMIYLGFLLSRDFTAS